METDWGALPSRPCLGTLGDGQGTEQQVRSREGFCSTFELLHMSEARIVGVLGVPNQYMGGGEKWLPQPPEMEKSYALNTEQCLHLGNTYSFRTQPRDPLSVTIPCLPQEVYAPVSYVNFEVTCKDLLIPDLSPLSSTMRALIDMDYDLFACIPQVPVPCLAHSRRLIYT